MKKVLYISNYSMYETKDFIVRDEDTRVASIFDKMIELAARKCDTYASDVFYDMKELYDCCQNGKHLRSLIFFEPHSVTSYNLREITSKTLNNSSFEGERQNAWLLVHGKKPSEYIVGRYEWETVLVRVNVRVKFVEDETLPTVSDEVDY